jgi:hypothetical protein
MQSLPAQVVIEYRECQKFVQSREHQKSPQNYDLDTFSATTFHAPRLN